MNTGDIAKTLGVLLSELVDGAAKDGGYMLNPGDEGLLRSIEKLSAADASARTPAGSSIAAHVDHVRYGLSLMNRWSQGENPFGSADWSASWRRTAVSEAEWRQRISELRSEAGRWLSVVRTPRDLDEIELNGLVGSIAHLAYHLGAIRQINQSTRGPQDGQKSQ
jgi:hypothetical protein